MPPRTTKRRTTNLKTTNSQNCQKTKLYGSPTTKELKKNIEEEVKAMKSEIKKNIQGTNSEGKKIGTQINNLEQKEEINIQPEHSEETRIQNEERLRNFRDNFKHSNI